MDKYVRKKLRTKEMAMQPPMTLKVTPTRINSSAALSQNCEMTSIIEGNSSGLVISALKRISQIIKMANRPPSWVAVLPVSASLNFVIPESQSVFQWFQILRVPLKSRKG